MELVASTPVVRLETRYGTFDARCFRDSDAREHVALSLGPTTPALVRIQSKCLTGTAFGSLACECGEQLAHALEFIGSAGAGILVYLDQEARGHGLFAKFDVLSHLNNGCDIVEAQRRAGVPYDVRQFDVARLILNQLGVKGGIELLTNNPEKIQALRLAGIDVAGTRRLLPPLRSRSQQDYYDAKASLQGHLLV